MYEHKEQYLNTLPKDIQRAFPCAPWDLNSKWGFIEFYNDVCIVLESKSLSTQYCSILNLIFKY